ncbi:DUF6779 domain-containing protein [Corynebacterium hansenii]|uniref:DUF6779 domain-containing protein n=1 Tax=Corynebacterium hansenii TaxID=394964 RepID=A0ABV7ZQL4_9CORY|nr:DUF6779 domain-containing protein [Corynebacterium hansenii]WJZ01059.1 hypothetical protein CHAN_12375 [Corynebacterium hansenii]
MTQPEDFDVDRNGQHPDVAESGHVGEWDERDDDAPVAGGPVATGDGDATDKVAMIMMVALIALAVVASIVMLFTDSTGWMKIAVLAGLWAAVIGALLVTRYRRQLAAERERIADLEVMHELELDREVATHREQELILEQNYLDSLDAKSEDTIAQLRAEIVALREHLAELLGQDLDEERIALRARAERLRELDAPMSSPLKDPESHQRPKPRATAHRAEATANGTVGSHTTHGPHGPTVTGVPEGWDRRDSFDSRDDSEPVDVPVVDGGPSGQSYGGYDTGDFRAVPWETTPATAPEKEPEPVPDYGWASKVSKPAEDRPAKPAKPAEQPKEEKKEEKAETKSQYRPQPDAAESRPTAVLPRIEGESGDSGETDAGWASDSPETADFPKIGDRPAHGAHEAAAATDAAAAAARAGSDAPADAEAEEEGSGRRSRHGRRRAEDHEGGLTVAELLAQMRARKDSGE